jgi:taurine dioxygenase
MANFNVDNITPTIGSTVNLDLAKASAGDMAEIRRLLSKRMVLAFPNQNLTREQHKALGTHFGTGVLHRHALAKASGSDDPDILMVRADANSKFVAGETWHTDVSCDPNPIEVSMLYMKQVPENGGGDTLFSSMYEALAGLSAPVRQLLEGLTARHNGALPWREGYGIEPPRDQPFNVTVHPVILHHPETGQPLLWVNSGFTQRILELSKHESDNLLGMLFSHVEREPKYQCRIRWQNNMLVMWDNLATQHAASWDYYPQTRIAERVSVIGPELATCQPATRA